MQQNGKRVTQSEAFTNELKALKPDITSNDRALAIKEFGVDRATISRYLNGAAINVDTAAKFIAFFKKCIAERNKVLQDV